jgi:hypothetical protein
MVNFSPTFCGELEELLDQLKKPFRYAGCFAKLAAKAIP